VRRFHFQQERDRERERLRYEASAKELQSHLNVKQTALEIIPKRHQEPYLAYYGAIDQNIRPGDKVLDLGAGTGLHTQYLVGRGFDVYALDISEESLKVCSARCGEDVKVFCGNIEVLPFEDNYFDWIVGTGILSYGKLDLVLSELLRTLKKSGGVIFLDSLSHNPIYRLNRFVHAIRGKRTFSTLRNMPRMKTIRSIRHRFNHITVQYFAGNILANEIFSQFYQNKLRKVLPQPGRVKWKRMAFKFLIVAKNSLPKI
jgi:ubiquinone/menaquinone biosynthesis C-methylase UbiE